MPQSNIGILELPDGSFEVHTPYNHGFVQKIRELPVAHRRWDPGVKAWIVYSREATTLASMLSRYYGYQWIPVKHKVIPVIAQLVKLRVDYIGNCRIHADGKAYASGWVDKGWGMQFPEQVLRNWFKAGNGPATLYSILMLDEAISEIEVQAAYRRMAKLWHPDVNPDPTASERFKQINQAYITLKDPVLRRRYDKGLQIERQDVKQVKEIVYEPPIRCGHIAIWAEAKLGVWIVSRIQEWTDIVDVFGRTRVVYWKPGADMFEEQWS